MSFDAISTINALADHWDLAGDEWGILALDFDQTLVKAKPTLGDEHFYRFLCEQNSLQGLNKDAHYHWTAKLRAKVIYESCEPFEKVNTLLQQFRNKKWSVPILTSRGLDMKEITLSHIQQSQLNFAPEDIIFKTFHPQDSKKLLFKDESLLHWVERQPQFKQAKKVRILFVDDTLKYLSEVARLSQKISSVTCLHYTGAEPNPKLSSHQMEQLLVQLYAHRTEQSIYATQENHLEEAIKYFQISSIQADLYPTIRKIAAEDQFPF